MNPNLPDLPSPLDSFPVRDMEKSETVPTLLIVDDEVGSRTAIKIIFQDSYRILQAENGEVALDLLLKNQVDVAILDILMAEMTGTELLGKIKEFDPMLEVIMLTAYETLETTREALRHGASDYLTKPFDVPLIREAVNHAYKKRQLSTARNAAADELLKIRQELQDQILNEKMTRAQGEIYANILHDINNPLSVITLYMGVLSQSIKDPDHFKMHQATLLKEMDCIRMEVKHCFNISRRYLGYLRHGGDEADFTSINQVLEDLQDFLQSHPDLNGHTLKIDLLPVDVNAAIHPIDLLQILLNLTSNALQCTLKKHEVRISVKLTVERIDLLLWKQDAQNRFVTGTGPSTPTAQVILEIKDNGPGIEEKILGQIFETQVTTKTAEEGTGLGLTIIKRLIEAAGGALHIHTEIGIGTLCTLYIPLTETRTWR